MTVAPTEILDPARVLADFDDGRLVHLERRPARPARYADPARPLPPAVAAAVGDRRLWAHQALAIDHIRAGRHTVVATGTASGKSLCYQLPIGEAVADPIRPGTAIVVSPTKALGHDQLRALTALDLPGVVAGVYDGDATPAERRWVRDNANVVFTNPEMLHTGLLPRHGRWLELLARLRFVVVDELHVLRGVFGTNVAHVLRRLRRVCRTYGADPTFVFCSATIGEPGRLAGELCGSEVVEVTDDASPAGSRTLAVVEPRLLDPDTGARSAPTTEAAALTAALIAAGHRTICFCPSRRGTEAVAAAVAERLGDGFAGTVVPYRAGYLPDERRAIEAALASGEARGVVATSALELGVDIGGLDAAVLCGFPGTIASLRQQAGRAGRGNAPALTALVVGDDQLDRWYAAHPHELTERAPEPAVVNLTNERVALPQIACAAYELPLSHDDERWWGAEPLHDAVRDLVAAGRLRLRHRQVTTSRRVPVAHWCATGFPAREIGLRDAGGPEYRIVGPDDVLVGTVDEARAFTAVHTGAIYVHRGEHFEVVELDLADRVARVRPADGTVTTRARTESEVGVRSIDADEPVLVAGGRAVAVRHLGAVEVVRRVTGYRILDARTRRTLGDEPLELPEQRLVTRAFWYTIDESVLADAGVAPVEVPGTLHAAEHALIALLPLFTICDRWDVGGLSTAAHPDTGGPTIFVHDAHPGGAGIAELGFAAGARHLAATRDLIGGCRCRSGCPSCVQSPKCGNGNEPLDKTGARRLLAALTRTGPEQ
ncbi:MAG: DEAD/DEAH box helicase [Actinomyces sp.]|nr:MAG: DEAD/DEAH box helicase [Actinomyces sp.]